MAFRLAGLLVMTLTVWPSVAQGGQSVTSEADVTVGRSTEGSTAASTQVRIFGATASDWRYFAEASWGGVRGPATDAFNSAYPYDNRIRAMEAYVEKGLSRNGRLTIVRAGRYRLPFGIFNRGDYAYSGFLRAPLIRYGENFALSNTFLEEGADVLVGTPALSLEGSLGMPADEGDAHRRRGLDTAFRGQIYYRSFIVGVSHVRTQPADPRDFATGGMTFSGVDARWTSGGTLLRGEWIDGQPFDTVRTRGGYLDAVMHLVGMGPVTAVARVERLDYDAGPFSSYLRRGTLGARVRIASFLTGQADVVRQPGGLARARSTAWDFGLTFSRRF